jgi:S-adenosylmethionine-dependent methyltransferase
MDDISDIARFYDQGAEVEDGRMLRHQLEFDLTWRYLERYLPSDGRVLEIGAATGRYTVELARRGYRVTAVDLSPVQLGWCRERLAALGLQDRVECVVADARDLSAITEQGYDAALLMGPLYHLVFEEDRRLALSQAIAHLRPGGILVSAHISRYGILGELMRKVPAWIEQADEVQSVMARGRDPEEYPEGHFRGYFCLVPEVAPLHEGLGLRTLALAGVEPAISADDESYNRLEGRQRALWLDLLYEVSIDPSTLGASRHLLYVGIKPESQAGEVTSPA